MRLLFDAELESGALSAERLHTHASSLPVGVREPPGSLARLREDVMRKLGRFDSERAVSGPLIAARRAVLGEAAPAPPRFLIRVDEFPHYRAWEADETFGTRQFTRFNEIMSGAGVPYLLAVLPRVSLRPLDPADRVDRELTDDERAMLRRLTREGVELALHGHTHRTRFRDPRRHSELGGLSLESTSGLLDRAEEELARASGVRAEVFVAPYNRFEARQWPVLASRFAVVGGGPESVRQLGFGVGPQWRGDAVYAPAYAPFYGTAGGMLGPAERAIETSSGLWTLVVLHWGWEAQAGWEDLRALARTLAPYAASWPEFLAAVKRSR